ncbi:MAG: M24 family metallopeptidase [Holosporales bacterium]|jgi:Xaa-Pro aminopeptidase|nr:M24 family metallopeptidase [Holosporales bacterium]
MNECSQKTATDTLNGSALLVNVASSPLCDVTDFVREFTGFTGSEGFFIIKNQYCEESMCPQGPLSAPDPSAHHGLMLVDSRYILQANAQCKGFRVSEIRSQDDLLSQLAQWCSRFLPAGAPIAYANLSMRQFSQIQQRLRAFTFVPFDVPPPDRQYEIERYDEQYCGASDTDKLNAMLAHIAPRAGVLMTSAESVAWTFNLRATKFTNTPTFPSAALITHAQTYVLVPSNAANDLCEDMYLRIPISDFKHKICDLIKQLDISELYLDTSNVPQDWYDALCGVYDDPTASIKHAPDPALARCVKNATELEHAKSIGRIESSAIIELLAWLDAVGASGSVGTSDSVGTVGVSGSVDAPGLASSPDLPITELDVAAKLEEFRQRSHLYRGPSFRSIVASGANGAIVHHSPTNVPCRTSVLIDVGGQYYGATTDMTRTVWVDAAPPPDDLRRAYTNVLRGHIALARAVFPAGTTGAQLDTLARQFLWQNRQDYGHGTGHGVGSYLGVHEGPCGISRGNMLPLACGMIMSNEPGMYLEGAFGVRLESLMACESASYEYAGRVDDVAGRVDDSAGRVDDDAGRVNDGANNVGNGANAVNNDDARTNAKRTNFLRFNVLTLVPFCSKLVNFDALTQEDKAWLEAYHKMILDNIIPLLSANTQAWARNECRKFL